MHRLYLQIYVSLLVVALVALLLTAIVGAILAGKHRTRVIQRRLAAEARLLAFELNRETSEPQISWQRWAQDRARTLGVSLALYDAHGKLLASSDDAKPYHHSARHKKAHRGHHMAHLLDDGRKLIVQEPKHHERNAHLGLAVFLALLATALAVGTYPIARRITRRLEALQQGVEGFGAGALSTRVIVDGKDEVARLAGSFNEAAARIEALVAGQKRMLASASHELRSPLARVRMAIELLVEEASLAKRAERAQEASMDIQELDHLIEDLLLASRLETFERPPHEETIHLDDLVQKEVSKIGGQFFGQRTVFVGDRVLLKRLIRNLLDNAQQHAYGRGIEAGVEALNRTGHVRLWVSDRGPGVPTELREQIFEPFYRPPKRHDGDPEGVGLGLALVREIAHLHAGRVKCKSRSGGGTTFEVELVSPNRPHSARTSQDDSAS